MIETLSITAPLFVAFGVGIAAGFWRRFADAQAGINAFVFYVALPAFLFVAVASAPMTEGVPFAFIAISVGGTIAVFLLVFAAARVFGARAPGVPPGPLAVAATYGNAGYLGVPIALSVLGPVAALGAALGQLLHNLVFMVGYPVLKSLRSTTDHDGSGRVRRLLRMAWTVTKRSILLNPVALSIFAGALVSLFDVHLPTAIDTSIDMIGQAAVPTAMFAVGLSIRPAFEGIRSGGVPLLPVLGASVVKLAVLPLVTVAAVVAFGGAMEPHWAAVAVIMAAMPVSSTASILVFEYDGDSRLVAAVTVVTSIAAVLTIPVAIALIP